MAGNYTLSLNSSVLGYDMCQKIIMDCAKALSYTPSPSLKNISTILKNGQDKVALTTASTRTANKESSKYGITSGASYCEGGDRS